MDLSGVAWRKSSWSTQNGSCVEAAAALASKEGSQLVIAVRDSKDPGGPKLIFTRGEWDAFTAGVKDGEFDIARAMSASALLPLPQPTRRLGQGS